MPRPAAAGPAPRAAPARDAGATASSVADPVDVDDEPGLLRRRPGRSRTVPGERAVRVDLQRRAAQRQRPPCRLAARRRRRRQQPARRSGVSTAAYPRKRAVSASAGAAPDLLDRAGLDEPSGAHHRHPVGDRERLVVVVGDQQRGRALARAGCRAGRRRAARAGPGRARTAARRAAAAGAGPRARGPARPAAARRRTGSPGVAVRRSPGSPTSSSSSATRAARARAAADARAAAAGRRRSRPRRGAGTAGRPGTSARSRAGGRAPGSRPAPSKRDACRRRARSRPATARSSVDLPQPDGPEHGEHLAASAARGTTSVDGGDVAEACTRQVAPRAVRHVRTLPRLPTRSRSTATMTAAVTAPSTTDAASAVPKLSAPGREIELVDDAPAGSGRRDGLRKLVAPNSPSDTAKAKPAAASTGARPPAGRRWRSTRSGLGAQRRGRLALPLVDAAQRRRDGRARPAAARPAPARPAPATGCPGSRAAGCRARPAGRSRRSPRRRPSGSMKTPSKARAAARGTGGADRPGDEHRRRSAPRVSASSVASTATRSEFASAVGRPGPAAATPASVPAERAVVLQRPGAVHPQRPDDQRDQRRDDEHQDDGGDRERRAASRRRGRGRRYGGRPPVAPTPRPRGRARPASSEQRHHHDDLEHRQRRRGLAGRGTGW